MTETTYTLREALAVDTGKWVHVYCVDRGCHHHSAVAFAPLAIRWGMDAPVEWIRRRLRCSRCGRRGARTIVPSKDVYTGMWQAFPAHLIQVGAQNEKAPPAQGASGAEYFPSDFP